MLPVTLRCPAVFDFNADGVSSLHRHNKCKSSQPQRIHNEYFPSQVLSAVVISLNLGTVASPPLIPPQVFFFFYLFIVHASNHVQKQWGFPHIFLIPVFLHRALLGWNEQSLHSFKQIFSCPWCCGLSLVPIACCDQKFTHNLSLG